MRTNRRRKDTTSANLLEFQLDQLWRRLLNFLTYSPFNFGVKNLDATSDRSVSVDNDGRTPGRRVIPRVEEAVTLLREAGLQHNHPDALYFLGEIYFHGLYAKERDFSASLTYHERLADISGNTTAQQRVGFIYSLGLGRTPMANAFAQRDRQALTYTTFAGSSGDTAAQMTLGYRYLYGVGVPKSCEESVFYYQLVADKAVAHFKSGPPGGRSMPWPRIRISDDESGVFGIESPPTTENGMDLEDVLEMYRLEADKGDLRARLLWGNLYRRGSARVARNFSYAFRYYRSVAMLVYTPNGKKRRTQPTDENVIGFASRAAALLGEMYWRGEGVSQNNATALRWFLSAAEHDDPVAQNALGVMYRDGSGVPKDLKKAISYFRAAAAKEGQYDAHVNLGVLYFNAKHYADAKQHFSLAAHHGHLLAQYYLADIHWEGHGTSKSCPLAVSLYKMVAEKGDWQYSPIPTAYQAYKRGDYETALLAYLQAAEMGYEMAQANAAWLLDKRKHAFKLVYALHPVRSADAAPYLRPQTERHGHLAMTVPYSQVALINWMRAANQGNMDARVKTGDYYFNGLGTEASAEQAARCYQSVAKSETSSLAMWNLGWMHENGIGVAKDFHLADRWYARALEVDPDAYIPVLLSRAKLHIRWTWHWLT
ncbi:hypothetical protein THASP1DRAFT_17714, partial [Thamnocephalis sphaerospora]